MRTTYLSDRILNHVYRNTAYTSPATINAALLTAVTDAEAGTLTEAAYTGYARVALTMGAPGAGGGGRKVLNSLLTFGQKTNAGTDSMIALGLHDGTNWTDIIFLDGADPIEVISTDVAGDTLSSPSHGLVADQRVRFETLPIGQTLPAGLSENTTYWVIAGGLTTDAFKVSATQGGGAVDITATGKGKLMRLTPKDVTINDTPQFAANSITVYDD